MLFGFACRKTGLILPVKLTDHGSSLLCGRTGFIHLILREINHEFPKALSVLISQFYLQSLPQGTFQTVLPARPVVVQVRTPASSFSTRVDEYPAGGAHQTNQGSLGQNQPAANTGALRYVPGTLLSLFCHLASHQKLLAVRMAP
jgi:hypothetical protein